MPLIPQLLLEPVQAVYDGATSKSAQKAYIRTILATTLSLVLLVSAAFGYILFYFSYVPQMGFDADVHMTYGEHNQKPWGITSIPSSLLIHTQPYDIALHITLPTTTQNYAVGNFMVNVSLMDSSASSPIFFSARRQTRLTHMSNIVATLDTMLRSPLYLSGVKREQEMLKVEIMEGVQFAKNQIPDFVAVSMGNDVGPWPEAYDVQINFVAKFAGVRWVMYKWRVTSFIVCTGAFWVVEMMWGGVGWMVISYTFSLDGQKEVQGEGRQGIKQEEESTDDEEEEDDEGALTPLTETRIYPLAPAEDDDSEEIPRPRGTRGMGVYATPEATPAPEEEGDVEDEVDSGQEGVSNGLGSDGDGGRYDSGIGTSAYESRGGRTSSTGLVQRRRSSRS